VKLDAKAMPALTCRVCQLWGAVCKADAFQWEIALDLQVSRTHTMIKLFV